jgi:DNA invertase Pin-like site-specific DNA recombinase
VVERAGWRIFKVYEDAGISGTKGRDQRPAFDQMLKAVAQRKFDVVMAWLVDRLGRFGHAAAGSARRQLRSLSAPTPRRRPAAPCFR